MNLVEGHRPIAPAPGIPSWDVDPYDTEILTSPNAYFSTLREKGEVVYIPRYSVLAVGRYETTRRVFSDHENFISSRGVGLDDFTVSRSWRPPSIILEVDPPYHDKTRKVLARALSPKVVKEYTELFEQTATALVDEILEKGTFDAVSEFAELFPTRVFPKAVGMREVNVRHLVDYGAMVFNSIGPDNIHRKKSLVDAETIVPWINAACARDRLNPGGLGSIVYDAVDAGEITIEEAGFLVRSFLSAGIDTTVTGIGNAIWCLSRNPDQWEALKADPSLIRPAFEEVLRFTSPVHTFCRTAGRDTDIAGMPVEEGTKILCVLGAANLDPEKWGDADVFRIDRRPTGHLGFGTGIHGCVGQNLARGELQAVLMELIKRVDRIEPAGDAVWRPNNAMHALDKLPIKIKAK